jgi:thiosulfate dehydrogenase [quinone] large subunit
MKQISNQQLAYFLLRITLGLNFLGHGLVRIPKIDGFRTWMVGEFQNSILPNFLASTFASVLPFIEFGVGLLLILGLFTRQTLFAGALVMISLIFGSCLIEKWEFVGFQMIYAIFFYLLIHNLANNALTLDKLKR